MTGQVAFDEYVAITQLKARYCRMLDTKDWAGFGELFTDDFELDVSEGSGIAPIRGREAAVARIRASIETATTAHQVHSPEIEVDGDVARVIWAMQDRVVWAPGEAPRPGFGSLTGYGHYHERYVRQDGRWRIAASRLTRLHLDIQSA